jgi:bifunctional non-homologous end joining protein LigD
MSLETYRKKRHFGKTSEPEGIVPEVAGRSYVIQKHDATRLHFDFRLEHDGVLWSWAIPKGPSLDPTVKRLAVHVEDHPVDYGSFEGTIPEGEYGGGPVMLWDRGTWSPIGDPAKGMAKGKLDFELHGERLRGRWHLVQSKGTENWLLIKGRDEFVSDTEATEFFDKSVVSGRTFEDIIAARPGDESEAIEELISEYPKRSPPKTFAPALATLVSEPPKGDAWIHEIKLDGYRMIAHLTKSKTWLESRRAKDWSAHFHPVTAALEDLGIDGTILDGEVVVLRPDGVTDFQSLQRYLQHESGAGALTYFVFDAPFVLGRDVRGAPLVQRKALVRKLLGGVWNGILRVTDHVEGNGATVFEEACRLGAEGIVSKERDAPYQQGRGRTWVKVKCVKRQELVIGGFTDPSGSRAAFGALLVGHYDGKDFVYDGRVGTGFNETTLRGIHQKLKALERKQSPFSEVLRGPEARGVHWVTPKLVAEVRYGERTADGRLRHPVFLGLREDKDASEVEEEVPVPTPTSKKEAKLAGGIAITHPERVVYPDVGLTKGDVADYYAAMAPWMLPHVVGRPLSLVRAPSGMAGQRFYQKHARETLKGAVRNVPVRESDGELAQYVAIDDAKGLVSLVQFGTLEVHPWGSTSDDLEHPDRFVIDLDPDEAIPWATLVEAASEIRGHLEAAGFAVFLKTTGGKGLHLVCPLDRSADWNVVITLTELVARRLAEVRPDRYVAEMAKRLRTNKIFVDYLRNTRGATAVAPYSTRALPTATVSVPLHWDELDPKHDLRSKFTVSTVPARMETIDDPWKEFLAAAAPVTAEAVDAIGAITLRAPAPSTRKKASRRRAAR